MHIYKNNAYKRNITNALLAINMLLIGHILSAALPKTKSIYILENGLRFVDCQRELNTNLIVDAWDMVSEGKETSILTKKELPIFYGIKPVFGLSCAECIPAALQEVDGGKYFCIFDCSKAISGMVLNGVCEPIALLSPCGWIDQLQKPGFCFFLNNTENKKAKPLYIAKIVSKRANTKLFRNNQNNPQDCHILHNEAIIRSHDGGGVDNDVSYSLMGQFSISEQIVCLSKKNQMPIVSCIPPTTESIEIRYHSGGLTVKKDDGWRYECTHFIHKEETILKKVPLFFHVNKENELSTLEKKITMHAIGQYTHNKMYLVLFDCTDLMGTAINYEYCCQPVAVIDVTSSKIGDSGFYKWNTNSRDCFYMHKIISDRALFYHGKYPITFCDQTKSYKTVSCQDLYRDFPMICGGLTDNSELVGADKELFYQCEDTVTSCSPTTLLKKVSEAIRTKEKLIVQCIIFLKIFLALSIIIYLKNPLLFNFDTKIKSFSLTILLPKS